MAGYGRPYKLRISGLGFDPRWPSAYRTAEARQKGIESLRLMDVDLYETLERKYGPCVIETWEVFEPRVTLHDPERYRPRR